MSLDYVVLNLQYVTLGGIWLMVIHNYVAVVNVIVSLQNPAQGAH